MDLDAATVAVLRQHRARQSGQRLLVGAGWQDTEGLVFTRPDGTGIAPDHVTKTFARRVREVGLPPIRLHGLRHSHAAALIAAGRSPIDVAKRLGHHSAAFALSVYGHADDDAGMQSAAAVAALVDGVS